MLHWNMNKSMYQNRKISKNNPSQWRGLVARTHPYAYLPHDHSHDWFSNSFIHDHSFKNRSSPFTSYIDSSNNLREINDRRSCRCSQLHELASSDFIINTYRIHMYITFDLIWFDLIQLFTFPCFLSPQHCEAINILQLYCDRPTNRPTERPMDRFIYIHSFISSFIH